MYICGLTGLKCVSILYIEEEGVIKHKVDLSPTASEILVNVNSLWYKNLLYVA